MKNEERCLQEGKSNTKSSDTRSSNMSSNLNQRANDVRDSSLSCSNRHDQGGSNGCCTVMWKANGKPTTLLLPPDSHFLKQRQMKYASSRDNNPEVNYFPI